MIWGQNNKKKKISTSDIEAKTDSTFLFNFDSLKKNKKNKKLIALKALKKIKVYFLSQNFKSKLSPFEISDVYYQKLNKLKIFKNFFKKKIKKKNKIQVKVAINF